MRKHTTTTDDRIREAGWFKGTDAEWRSLSGPAQREAAFAGTGCEVAYATWAGPVECLHIGCRIRRGELPRIALTNAILRSEAESGWLRFASRRDLAVTMRAIRNAAKASGIYNPWEIPGGWNVMVGSAVGAV